MNNDLMPAEKKLSDGELDEVVHGARMPVCFLAHHDCECTAGCVLPGYSPSPSWIAHRLTNNEQP